MKAQKVRNNLGNKNISCSSSKHELHPCVLFLIKACAFFRYPNYIILKFKYQIIIKFREKTEENKGDVMS